MDDDDDPFLQEALRLSQQMVPTISQKQNSAYAASLKKDKQREVQQIRKQKAKDDYDNMMCIQHAKVEDAKAYTDMRIRVSNNIMINVPFIKYDTIRILYDILCAHYGGGSRNIIIQNMMYGVVRLYPGANILHKTFEQMKWKGRILWNASLE